MRVTSNTVITKRAANIEISPLKEEGKLPSTLMLVYANYRLKFQ
ncbi:23117_t:CDS:2 [Entrophospora sp. SA101]|nr:23117_t:CDS:2 [Entrophospora sp. SA101]